MKKKRGFLSRILFLLMAVFCVIGLSACSDEACVHDWGEWIDAIPATCTQQGLQTSQCSNCNELRTQAIEALEHDWKEANCMAPKTCAICGEAEGTLGTHAYAEEIVKPEALKSEATCDSPAVYYKSCVCGEISTEETFTNGSALSHAYTDEIVKPEALKSEATCQSPAVYYKSCGCGDISDSETFESGAVLAHSYIQEIVKPEALKSEATSTSPAIYYKSCGCGAISDSETFELKEEEEHLYTLEIVKPEAIKSEATCQSPAVYYKSCKCGAISDSETFESGAALAHSYTLEIVKPEAIKSEATCQSPAVYYKSCKCGAISDSETFESGAALAHSYTEEIVKPEAIKSEATCQSPAVYYKSCKCGAISDSDTFESGKTSVHNYVNGLCEVCGEKEVECDHSVLHDGVFDFSEYGCCETKVEYQICSCGEIVYADFDSGYLTCQFDEEKTEQKEYTDEEGLEVMEVSCACSVCGMQIIAIYKTKSKDCRTYVFSNHTFITKEGVTIVENVTYEKSYVAHANTYNTVVKAAEYGFCGGDIEAIVCLDCKKMVRIFEMYLTCKVDLPSDIKLTEAVIDGVTHKVGESKCPDCNSKVTIDKWNEEISQCVHCEHELVEWYGGDTLLFSDPKHEYEYNHTNEETIEKFGDTCDDGYILTRHCTVCDETETINSKGHLSESFTLDLNGYEGLCGGEIVYNKCEICEENVFLSLNGIKCNLNLFGMEPVETVVDGITHYVSNIKCPTCSLLIVREEWREKVSDCETADYLLMKIYAGDEQIFEFLQNSISTYHDWEETYEMHGETCDEGYTATATCKICGKTDTYEGRGHNFVNTYIKLEEYGLCGGLVYGNKCAICEEDSYFSIDEIYCEIHFDESKEPEEKEVDGITHFVYNFECPNCSLVAVKEIWEESTTSCEVRKNELIKIYADEKLIFEWSQHSITKKHTWEVTFKLHGDDCDNGYDIIQNCSVCNQTTTTVRRGHYIDELCIDLKEHDLCGGMLYIHKCRICEKMFSYYTIGSCINFDDMPEAEEKDVDGITHFVYNFTCPNCSLIVVKEIWEENISDCEVIQYESIKFYAGEKLIFEDTKYNTVDKHQWEYSYVMNGATCEEGYVYIKSCTVCSNSEEIYENKGHEFTDTYIDLSEHGACYGTIRYSECNICKENYDFVIEWTCVDLNNFPEAETKDVDGVIHYIYNFKCLECSLVIIKENWQESISVCETCNYELIKVYIGEKLVCENSRYYTNYNHKFEETYVMNGATCDSGYLVLSTCKNCGQSSSHESWGHLVMPGHIDLKEHGICGGYINYSECSVCKEMYYFELIGACIDIYDLSDPVEKDVDGITHFVYNFECSNCSLVAVKEIWEESITTCEFTKHELIKIYAGDELLFDYYKYYTDSNHEFETTYKMNGETCDNGYEVITTCKNCNQTDSYEGRGHNRKTAYIDLKEHDICGGSISYDKCDVCGEIEYYRIDIFCIDIYDVSDPVEKDVDGVTHRVYTFTCPNCSLVAVREMWEENITTCDGNNHELIKIYAGDELLFEHYQNSVWEDHQYEDTYKMYGETCDSGYEVITTCKNCNQTYSYERAGHNFVETYIELEDHGLCGGLIYVGKCTICGENSHYSDKTNCIIHFDESKEPEEKEVDGVTRFVYSFECPNCSLVAVKEMWEENITTCEVNRHELIKIYAGVELLLEHYQNSVSINHQYEATYKMHGASCDEGFEVINTCKNCNQTYSYEGRGHFYEQFEINLKEHGICGGSILSSHCQLCEAIYPYCETYDLCIDLYNLPEAVEEEVDGITHFVYTFTCPNCPLIVVKEVWTEDTGVFYELTKFYKGEELIFQYTFH